MLKFSNLYLRLLSYSKPYWRGFVLAFLATIVLAGTEAAFPALIKPLFDSGFSNTGTFPIWWVPVIVLAIFLVRGSASFLSSYSMNWVANNILRDLRSALFERLLLMPSHTFDRVSSGQLISKIVSEVTGITVAATNVLNTLVRDGLILLGLIVWLVWLNWKLALVILILAPVLILTSLYFSRRMRRVSGAALRATADLTTSVEEAISAQKVIKIYQGENFEKDRFENINKEFRAHSMRAVIAQALQTPLTQFIVAIGVASVLTIALLQSRHGEVSTGDFVSFLTAMLLMLAPIRHLTDINAQLQRGLASAEVVFALIDEKGEQDKGQLTLGRARGEIEFSHISLKYPTKSDQALTNISLKIQPGTTVAFVGPSGGGKTSILNLLPRLYEPLEGSIKIDGIDISDISLSSLRSQFALVSQDIVLFNDTLRANISYSVTGVSDEELMEIVRAADLAEFVAAQPLGLDTNIGERGLQLSGGQRQRVAIARAILRDAPILLLDEATSALDSQSESRIKAAIDNLRIGRTTLIVAHRLSTIQNADRIYVVEYGQIVEEGTHTELLQRNGRYQSLYRNHETNG